MPQSFAKIDLYSKKVRNIKVTFILIVIILFITTIFVSYNYKEKGSVSLNNKKDPKNQTENDLNVRGARFYSSSNQNEPFELFSEQISQININEFLLSSVSAVVHSLDGREIILNSNEAIWNQEQKFLKLTGKVFIRFKDEYTINSDNINYDLKNNILCSKTKSYLNGKLGNLIVMGFNLNNYSKIINFTGPINLHIDQNEI